MPSHHARAPRLPPPPPPLGSVLFASIGADCGCHRIGQDTDFSIKMALQCTPENIQQMMMALKASFGLVENERKQVMRAFNPSLYSCYA